MSAQAQQAAGVGTGRTQRVHDTARMQDIIAAEKAVPGSNSGAKKRRKKRKKSGNEDDNESEYEDASSSESDTDDEVQLIPNDEVADNMASKTAPPVAAKPARKRRKDNAGAAAPAATKTVAPPVDPLDPKNRKVKKGAQKTNPIYHFYEEVAKNPHKESPLATDVNYKCYHGQNAYFTITKSMNGSLNGLINNLKKFPALLKLYEVLKDAKRQPTADELLICQGKLSMTTERTKELTAEYLKTHKQLDQAFEKQREKQQEPFSQKKFEELLLGWIVTCDQPFDEVDKPEFRALLEYIHGRPGLEIPHRHSVQRKVMELGTDTIERTKAMIQDLDCKVSLSLDAWTSSNQYAFLAIVMHYISKDGTLSELLIDFKEILGSHSGDNMAEIVWNTLTMYGLNDRILTVMADNATSNDTLLDALAKRCNDNGIPFDARQSRLRCMPHTIHLAACQLLEGIGAIKKEKKDRRSNYQEDIAVPLTSAALDDAEALDDDGDAWDDEQDALGPEAVLRVVPKLRHIIRKIRASPGRRKDWLRTATVHIEQKKREHTEAQADAPAAGAEASSSTVSPPGPINGPLNALMLILDVATRWSSTHQMLGRALDFKDIIIAYTEQDRNDLRDFRLSDADWEALEIVEHWLVSFRYATQAMSATKTPMLSSVHAVYRGLQESCRESLRKLPDSCNPRLKAALIAAHKKLSDYYWKIDNESPFYLWASFLDPRIMYDGLKRDCTEEDGMTEADLNAARDALVSYYNANYSAGTRRAGQPEPPQAAAAATTTARTQPFDFMARYDNEPRRVVNEIEEFFRQPREDMRSCDPIKWWIGRRAMWPNLARMALDILSIPGSAVAVERIFSGGRDTISIRRANLKPETIRALMLVKQWRRQLRDVIILD